MKNISRDKEVLKKLQAIPNVGPATAEDLYRLGIRAVEDLMQRDAETMYEELCLLDGVRLDPCVQDVFAAAIYFAKGKGSKPWWHFSRIRKAAKKMQADGNRRF